MSELHGEYVSAMFVYLKSGLLFEVNNPAMVDACDRMAEVSRRIWTRESGHAEMRFRYDGIYVNQTFFVPPADKALHSEYVASVWRALGVAAVAPTNQTERGQWQELARGLQRFVRGESALPRMTDVIVQGLPLLSPRLEDGPTAGDERWELFQAYFYAVSGLQRLFAGRSGQVRQLVGVKRPLMRLIGASQRYRDLLLALAYDVTREWNPDEHAVRSAMVIGWMALELGLSRTQAIELAMAGLLHGCELSIAESLQRQVELRQTRERNILRMTLVNEARMKDVAAYPYDPSLASRLIGFAHDVKAAQTFAGVWKSWKPRAP